ncbi:MAG: helix-turn-helix transcriptional regulator [Bacillota bacterium]|nr:helix-turn-helix transcriptional regulator [Bacillota bacterium]
MIHDKTSKGIFLVFQGIWVTLSASIILLHSFKVFLAVYSSLGIISGVIFIRFAYNIIFYVPKNSWIKTNITAYIFLQVIYYVYHFPPANRYTPFIYIAAVLAVQLPCLYSFLRFKGNILEVRRNIPPVDINLKTIMAPVIFFTIMLWCQSMIKNIVMPSFEKGGIIIYYVVIPHSLTLVLLFILRKKLKRIHLLTAALILVGLTLITFQLFNGSLAGQFVANTLKEPYSLFWGFFAFSFIVDITYKYGKKFILERVMFISIMLIMILSEALSLVMRSLVVKPQYYVIFYIMIFVMLFLLPYMNKFFNNEFPEYTNPDKTPYTFLPYRNSLERLKNHNLTSGDDSVNITDNLTEKSVSLDLFLELLPEGLSLTPREKEVLEHICDGQDRDVLANILGISENTVKIHIRNIYSKFGVKNRDGLYALAGMEKNQNELTKREKEVYELLCKGKSENEISRELFISNSTTRFYIWNIRRKKYLNGNIEKSPNLT